MLKWAMRIVAVGGALLAMAVGTAAGLHWANQREWSVATPRVCAGVVISPQYVWLKGWSRSEMEPGDLNGEVGQYEVKSEKWEPSEIAAGLAYAKWGKEWHGFGVIRGMKGGIPSYTAVLCPTWAVLAVLLLPMGLWAGIGWRQRRQVMAGHCVGCGYDLRASSERCPECGREVKKR